MLTYKIILEEANNKVDCDRFEDLYETFMVFRNTLVSMYVLELSKEDKAFIQLSFNKIRITEITDGDELKELHKIIKRESETIDSSIIRMVETIKYIEQRYE